MEILSIALIILGTAVGGFASWKNKYEADILEKENTALLRKNVDLSEELKKASDENLLLSKKSDRYVEEMNFFNRRDFGFIKLGFPYGYTVIKQNDEYDDFTKVYGNKPFNIDFKSKITKNQDGKYVIQLNEILISYGNSKFSSRSVFGEIDIENFSQVRLIFSIKFVSKLKNIRDSYRIGAIMIDGGDGILYAVGIQKDEEPSQLSQIVYDLDKA
jgi:hypothetical protein